MLLLCLFQGSISCEQLQDSYKHTCMCSNPFNVHLLVLLYMLSHLLGEIKLFLRMSAKFSKLSDAGVQGLIVPLLKCSCVYIAHNDHKNTTQVYSATVMPRVMTHVMALKRGQSDMGKTTFLATSYTFIDYISYCVKNG